MFTLSYLEQGLDKRHPLSDGETSVGRSPACVLVIDDDTLSRRHAVFRVSGGRCTVRDAGSSNGTAVNDHAVTQATVSDGDIVKLGRLALQINESADDQLSLSEEQLVLGEDTVYRPVTDVPGTAGAEAARVDATRLFALLSEIGRTLVDVESLSDILERVTALVFTAVAADRCFLLLRDRAGDELVPRVVTSRDGSQPANATVSRTVLAQVMERRVALLARNALLDSELGRADSIVAQNVRSFMCAPLWNQREVIGVLYADTPRAERFVDADLDLFAALSNYAAVAIERARLAARVQDEQRRRERLARYHSPRVVDRILDDTAEADGDFIAQERDVSVLFADIVGFTSYAEGRSPHATAQALNRCLASMSDAVFAEDGTLDKFLGDAVLAVFGAPFDQPDHAQRAVRAAVGIQRAMAALPREADDAPLEVRVGINSGRAMTGDVGSPRRREYTVLGDVVNTASRVQSDVAQPGQIVITRSTRDQLDDRLSTRSLGSIRLRGRVATIELFEVADERQ